jgi:hypothetical protein
VKKVNNNQPEVDCKSLEKTNPERKWMKQRVLSKHAGFTIPKKWKLNLFFSPTFQAYDHH